MDSSRQSKEIAPILVWFQRDLRLRDQPALFAAVASGRRVIPCFIWSPEEESPWQPGAASRWWLHQSLKSLDQSLRSLGSRLIIRFGPTDKALRALGEETGATAIYGCQSVDPSLRVLQKKIEASFSKSDIEIRFFAANLLFDPSTIKTKTGKSFQVFTPFWRECLAQAVRFISLPKVSQVKGAKKWPTSERLTALQLEPKIHWAQEMKKYWQPGESGAEKNLKRFLKSSLANYKEGRDQPALLGTSQLSPHLHFGEISPRSVWATLDQLKKNDSPGVENYRRELGWREFAHYLLFHFPKTANQPLYPKFEKFPWEKDSRALKRWQKGKTGFPIVDAGMRQLWAIGWMHNRVRMIVASFLVKDLLISWQEGARWFWDTLVDADLANNTLGWQWSAGCGADAAPYFRIFNPVLQGERFDPDGDYVRRWVPELRKMPARWIHQPWKAPSEILKKAGVVLGQNYSLPIVSHDVARVQALQAFRSLNRLTSVSKS